MLLISFPKEKLCGEIQALLLFMVGTYRAQENHHLFRSFRELPIRSLDCGAEARDLTGSPEMWMRSQ